MVSHHPAKFGEHRHLVVEICGDILVIEGQDSTYPRFNLPLMFISKRHGLKAHVILTPILITRA